MPPTPTKAPLAEAERLWRAGNLAKAEALFREALKKAPSDPAALVGVARAEFVRGEKKKALECLSKAEKIAPKRADVMVTRGVFAEAEKDGERALEIFRDAAAANPKSAEARFNHGRILGKAGKLAEAEAELQAAIALDPENAMYHFHLAGIVGREPKRLAEAIRMLGRAIELNGRFVEAYCLLAEVLEDLGQLDNAEKILASANRCVPENRMILERIAALYERRAQLGKARDAMREVAHLKSAEKDSEIWRRLALLELAAGDGAQAEACGLIAGKLAPKSAEIHFANGIIAETIGKKEAAKAFYRKAIELDPRHWGAMVNLGRMLMNEKKPAIDEAVKLEEKAKTLAPSEPAPVLNLAFAYAAKGDKAKAAASAKAVLGMGNASKAMKEQAKKLVGAGK